mgnify:CR=1 FL=1
MPPEPIILAFDTAAAHCAAVVVQGGEVLAQRVEPMQKGQAERLFPLMEELLQEAGENWQSLDAVGVGIGPGNFTGIRISVSAARGLALSLGIPAIGVSRLEAMAFGLTGTALIDARQNRVYQQEFQGGVAQGDVSLLALEDVIAPVPIADGPLGLDGLTRVSVETSLSTICSFFVSLHPAKRSVVTDITIKFLIV